MASEQGYGVVKEKFVSPKCLANNDALAHVYLLQEPENEANSGRIYTEFITDMGERLVDQPFYGSYKYDFDGRELVYDTGLRLLDSLRKSVYAAKKDVGSGYHSSYHLSRQEAFLKQGGKLLEWLRSDCSSKHLLFVSLCPEENELSYTQAMKQGFKPKRKMASLQLHSKTDEGYITKAFSLDNINPAQLSNILYELYGFKIDANSTIELLSKPIYIDQDDNPDKVASALINTHDKLLNKLYGYDYMQGVKQNNKTVEANSFVVNYPEVYDLYKSVIYEVAYSLNRGLVSTGLINLLNYRLLNQYGKYAPSELVFLEGDLFNESSARTIIEYVRSRAIPEYLNSKLTSDKQYNLNNSCGYSDIGEAGANAYINGVTYGGLCPSSGLFGVNVINNNTVKMQATSIQLIEAVYDEPKPIMTKNGFNVIPIGSCPVCGAECGVGIQNIKTKKWHCVQSNCAAFDSEVYAKVFLNNNSVKNYEFSNETTKDDNHIMLDKNETQIRDLRGSYKDLYWERWLANYNYQNTTDNTKKAEYLQKINTLDVKIVELNYELASAG